MEEVDQWKLGSGSQSRVSIIIPVYNRAKLVEEALHSVYRQTYRPIEVVVVDDGSTDTTPAVVRDWMQAHQHEDFLCSYVSQSNSGAPAARNAGVEASTGQYIQFLDSDDKLLPQKLERGVQKLREENLDMVYCRTATTDLEDNRIGYCGGPVSKSPADIPSYSWHISGPLYKRDMLQTLGPWLEELTGSQDWEYCARVKIRDFDIHFDRKVGSLYRHHRDEVRVSRVGMEYDYTRSTEQAYDHIYQLANECGKAGPSFSGRMARLYFYRFLAYRNNGYKIDAKRCLGKIITRTPPSYPIWTVSVLCHYIPSRALTLILQRLVDLRNKVKAWYGSK